MKFDFSNWNYSYAKDEDPEIYAQNCADLGLTVAMLPRSYFGEDEFALKIMDALHKKGIKVIVKDTRTSWDPARDFSVYESEIESAKSVFNDHPAFWMHCVRDEPFPNQFDDVGRMCDLMYEKNCPAFVSHHPFYSLFKETFGSREYYAEYLAEYTAKHHIPLISYDRYTQMYDPKVCSKAECEEGMEEYYLDLNAYHKAAELAGVPAWTTLLCEGHMMLRTPNYDDILFQITTTIAHGFSGLLWFYPFAYHYTEQNYGCPVNSYGERTEIFTYIAHATRLVKDYLLKPLEGYEFVGVRHFGKMFGGTKEYEGEYGFGIESIWHGHGIISEFSNGTDTKHLLVNNSDHSDRFKITYPGHCEQDYFQHLPTGGFVFVDKLDARIERGDS